MHSRLLAWIALLATLFSAASPTLAAALLSHEPAALARMIGLPAAAADADRAEHAHQTHQTHQTHEEAHHETAPQQESDGESTQSHPAHGIHCSLCLNPSSIATIAPAPVSSAVLHLAYHVSPPALSAPRYAAFHPSYRSRAPPRVS